MLNDERTMEVVQPHIRLLTVTFWMDDRCLGWWIDGCLDERKNPCRDCRVCACIEERDDK